MKYELTKKLFQGNTSQALAEIDSIYHKQGFCVVSYVYGAVIIRYGLLQPIIKDHHIATRQKALFSSDIVLPDGAALRTRRRIAYMSKKVHGLPMLYNLNGTDFFPQLLEYYLSQGPVNLVCYGTYGGNISTKSGEVIMRAGEWLYQKYGINRSYWQDIEYGDNKTERNREAMRQACNPAYPTIMMVCLGVPRQELRSYQNRKQLEENHIICCNQGATIDYWAGREVRAPWLIRALRIESVWRLISDPRKNWSKFWVSWKMMGEVLKLCVMWVKEKICGK